MVARSVLAETALDGELATASVLKPKGSRWKRVLAADLLLTALVDAFSILVIFLLMSFSSTGDLLMIGKNTELPKAVRTDVIERNPVVKVEDGKIFLENVAVTGDSLIQALLDLRKKFADDHPGEEYPGAVTVQADRRIKYDFLNQVVTACAHAGFSDIRFAVLSK